MKQLDRIIPTLEFFTKLLGEQTEIVVHDLKAHKIVWISNGYITERAVDYKDDPTTMSITKARVSESPDENMYIGIKSITKGTVHLRSSTLFLKDEYGEDEYAICVNQDLTGIDAIKKLLNQFETVSTLEQISDSEESVESIAKQLIFEEIEKEKPFSSDSREAKMAIIQRLDDKGVFEVKGSIAIVCELLQIAQATLYKYLKMIRNGD